MAPVNFNTNQMVRGLVYNAENKPQLLGSFLKEANLRNLQGPALVSYFTEVNKITNNKKYLSREISDRLEKLPEIIESEVKKSPKLQYEADKFSLTLQHFYPKTLNKRIALASEGAVVEGKVEPKSKFKKFMVWLNQFLREE